MKNYLIILMLLSIFFINGCAGLGFEKKTTLMPDEVWVQGDTNFDEEDSGKYIWGIKWKLGKVN